MLCAPVSFRDQVAVALPILCLGPVIFCNGRFVVTDLVDALTLSFVLFMLIEVIWAVAVFASPRPRAG